MSRVRGNGNGKFSVILCIVLSLIVFILNTLSTLHAINHFN
ncbi:hypothetical protein [Clostridium perfringens]